MPPRKPGSHCDPAQGALEFAVWSPTFTWRTKKTLDKRLLKVKNRDVAFSDVLLSEEPLLREWTGSWHVSRPTNLRVHMTLKGKAVIVTGGNSGVRSREHAGLSLLQVRPAPITAR